MSFQRFLEYIFYNRRRLIEGMIQGNVSEHELLIGSTVHTPVIISCGSAGLNGSVKGIGFVPQKRFLARTTERILEILESNYSMKDKLGILLEEVYRPEKVDFKKLSSIELAKKHTWINLRENPVATIVFYTPPSTSYEIRAKVTIHENDEYWKLVNAIHDLFHGFRGVDMWKKTPVYVFHIDEIYDNSVNKMGESVEIPKSIF